jgi:hypothetical protein
MIHMKSLFAAGGLLAMTLLMSGCAFMAHDIGFAGKNPGSMECKGKAVVTVQGSMTAGSGIMGSGINGGTVTFDCGDGAFIKQGPPTTDPAVQGQSPAPPATVTSPQNTSAPPPATSTAPASGPTSSALPAALSPSGTTTAISAAAVERKAMLQRMAAAEQKATPQPMATAAAVHSSP